MNVHSKICLALAAGAVMVVASIEWARAAAKPPGYLVVEYEIIDPAGFKSYVRESNALKSTRIFLARHAKGTSLSGEPPKWIGIIQYPSVDEALAHDASPEYAALKPLRDKSTKWRSYVVEALPN